MGIIRAVISLLSILTLYLMGLYANGYYDGEKDAFLFRLSVPDGLRAEDTTFLYKRVIKIRDGCFAFYFKGKPVWVKPRDPDSIKCGDLVSLYGHFGEGNMFYAEGCRLERVRALKIGVSCFGCLIAFLLFFKAYRFNLKLFLWEPREDA